MSRLHSGARLLHGRRSSEARMSSGSQGWPQSPATASTSTERFCQQRLEPSAEGPPTTEGDDEQLHLIGLRRQLSISAREQRYDARGPLMVSSGAWRRDRGGRSSSRESSRTMPRPRSSLSSRPNPTAAASRAALVETAADEGSCRSTLASYSRVSSAAL